MNKIISTIFLLASNIYLVYGVYYLKWDLATIFILFWTESAAIGILSIPKIILAKEEQKTISPEGLRDKFLKDQELMLRKQGKYDSSKLYASKKFANLMFFILKNNKILTVMFFILHFGGFMGLYFLFIFHFLGSKFDLVPIILPAMIIVYFSHSVSFFVNYIVGKEYEKLTTNAAMWAPYKRILPMQCALFIGANGGLNLNLFLILRVTLDFIFHFFEHRKKEFIVRNGQVIGTKVTAD